MGAGVCIAGGGGTAYTPPVACVRSQLPEQAPKNDTRNQLFRVTSVISSLQMIGKLSQLIRCNPQSL